MICGPGQKTTTNQAKKTQEFGEIFEHLGWGAGATGWGAGSDGMGSRERWSRTDSETKIRKLRPDSETTV